MFSNNGFIICVFIYASSHIYGDEIDLIAAINCTTKSYIEYLNLQTNESLLKILNLSDTNVRDLHLIRPVSEKIFEIFSNQKNFTICVELKQDQKKHGTIFSITDRKNHRLLEISISIEKKEVKLIYSVFKNRPLKKILNLKLSESRWHTLCLEIKVQNKQIQVTSDGFNEVHVPFLKFQNRIKKQKEIRIYIGQRNKTKSYFKGVIKRMTFSTKSSYSVDFYASPKEKTTISDTTSNLDLESIISRLNLLEKEVMNLKMKLIESNIKLTELEKCQCLPTCISLSGEKKRLFEKWQENNCQNCTCTEHGTKCDQEKCPKLDCIHKIKIPGKCCPRCGNSCHYRKKIYYHTQNFTIKCMRCHCNDGSLFCQRINIKLECPRLNCSRFQQVQVSGKCCRQCKKINFCDFGNCGANAFCIASSAIFNCQCKPGFIGNPFRKCEDINECEHRQTCPFSTECVNSEGSFTCVCKPGYIKLNSSSLSCTPTCIKNECKNNSTCVAPDKCECAVGFTGPQCDTDIDECKLGLIKCPANSECLNIHGSYICKCIHGYKSKENGKMSVYYDYQCKDIDECLGIRGLDYICDIHSICVNTLGGYECISEKEKQEEKICKVETSSQKIEILENNQVITHKPTCTKCKCLNGKVICFGIQCNCEMKPPNSCCRNCFPNKCPATTTFNGDSEFQGFICMVNNTLCLNKECPKIFCQDSVDLLGQCCKFCRSDHITSCMLQYNNSKYSPDSDLYNSCYYKDKLYENGGKFIFQHYLDESCLKCLCWNQNFCCAKSFSCKV